MTAIARPESKRCGRTRRHTPHPWVRHPDDLDEFTCDGRVGPRSAGQLIAERPALRTLPAAGAFLAEGAISA